jgi:hypothetical protein
LLDAIGVGSGTEGNQPVAEGEVRAKLARFSLSEAELENLCQVIDTQRKLDEMIFALRADIRNKLKSELQKRAHGWRLRAYQSGSDKTNMALLLAAQAIAGPDLLHPTFAGLEREIARFRDEFVEILVEAMPPAPHSEKMMHRFSVVPDSREIVVGSVGMPGHEYLTAFTHCTIDLTEAVGEHPFWRALARKLVADKMARRLRLPNGVLFDVDVGALTKFSSNLSTSAPA